MKKQILIIITSFIFLSLNSFSQEIPDDFQALLKKCAEDRNSLGLFSSIRDGKTTMYLFSNLEFQKFVPDYMKLFASISSSNDKMLPIVNTLSGDIVLFIDPFYSSTLNENFRDVVIIDRCSIKKQSAQLQLRTTTATHLPVNGFDYKKIKYSLEKAGTEWSVRQVIVKQTSFKNLDKGI